MNDSIGVYVHFPYCLTKCPYCDFHSVTAKEPGSSETLDAPRARAILPHEAYADAVLRELEARAKRLPLGLRLESVFFGGGTPSLWDPRQMARVLRGILDTFSNSSHIEVTAESNPTSLDKKQLAGMLEAGINRVSVGVQSVETKTLEFLGRLHDSEGGLRAIERALAAGVPRVSADLIFGVDRQSPQAAEDAALLVASLGVTHLSAYALTIEENTKFGALARAGRLPLLGEELVAESFERVSKALEARGFRHYEVSNFARPGHESVHNRRYWLGYDYLGLGSGAFGTVGLEGAKPDRVRYKNVLAIERYLEAFAEPPRFDVFEEKLADRELISPDDTLREAILLGLRLRSGLDTKALEARVGAPFWNRDRERAFERQLGLGNLVGTRDTFAIPLDRWLHADGIIRNLL